MPCKDCGGRMLGDGWTTPYHCERVERPNLESDAAPTYCGDADEHGVSKKEHELDKAILRVMLSMPERNPLRECKRCGRFRHTNAFGVCKQCIDAACADIIDSM